MYIVHGVTINMGFLIFILFTLFSPYLFLQKLDDEIKNELERCQTELRAVSAHNQTQLKRLVKLAREEMARQEIRNK